MKIEGKTVKDRKKKKTEKRRKKRKASRFLFQSFTIAGHIRALALGDFKTDVWNRAQPPVAESRRSNTRNIRDITPASYEYSPRTRYSSSGANRKYTGRCSFFTLR